MAATVCQPETIMLACSTISFTKKKIPPFYKSYTWQLEWDLCNCMSLCVWWHLGVLEVGMETETHAPFVGCQTTEWRSWRAPGPASWRRAQPSPWPPQTQTWWSIWSRSGMRGWAAGGLWGPGWRWWWWSSSCHMACCPWRCHPPPPSPRCACGSGCAAHTQEPYWWNSPHNYTRNGNIIIFSKYYYKGKYYIVIFDHAYILEDSYCPNLKWMMAEAMWIYST